LTLYDEIVKALSELGGEAKVEQIYRIILNTDREKQPTRNTICATLRNHRAPREGKKYYFYPKGNGIWKMIPKNQKKQ